MYKQRSARTPGVLPPEKPPPRPPSTPDPLPTAVTIEELVNASNGRDIDRVKLLMRANPKVVSRCDNQGRTVLHHACGKGNLQVGLNSCRSNELPITFTFKTNFHFLSLFPSSPFKHFIRLLITFFPTYFPPPHLSFTKRTSMVSAVHPFSSFPFLTHLPLCFLGETPLHRAARFNHSAIARLLLRHGASLTTRDLHGNSPLHVAAHTGKAEMVELLVGLGADMVIQNNVGATPLDVAKASTFSNKKVVGLLQG